MFFLQQAFDCGKKQPSQTKRLTWERQAWTGSRGWSLGKQQGPFDVLIIIWRTLTGCGIAVRMRRAGPEGGAGREERSGGRHQQQEHQARPWRCALPRSGSPRTLTTPSTTSSRKPCTNAASSSRMRLALRHHPDLQLVRSLNRRPHHGRDLLGRLGLGHSKLISRAEAPRFPAARPMAWPGSSITTVSSTMRA